MYKKITKIGCFTAIVGLFFLVTSLILFGASIWRATIANEVASIPFNCGEKKKTGIIVVDTDKYCMLAITFDFVSTSVKEKKEFDKIEYMPRYRFPVSYKIWDNKENSILEETRIASWNADRITSISHKDVNNTGGAAVIRHNFSKFKVQPPGQIIVEVEVGPDSSYQAEIQSLELKIYDNVSKHSKSVWGGCFLFFVGAVTLIAGIILLVTGLAKTDDTSSEQIKEEEGHFTYSCCITRRFAAVLFDIFFLTIFFSLVNITLGCPNLESIAVAINLPLLFIIMYLPELFFGQTLGMLIFDVIVLTPKKRPSWQSLIIRRLVNLVELFLPSAVYYYVTALSKNCRSLSDRSSGCKIVRKKYLSMPPTDERHLPSKRSRIITATLFFALPIILLFLLFPFIFILILYVFKSIHLWGLATILPYNLN
jgi:hypothetical protein